MEQNQIQINNKKQQIKAFSDIVNNAYYQNQLQRLFGKNAGTFATSMMELYTSNADLHLALRSGQYETINTRVVYKGELLGEDKLSGFIDISGEKESNEVVGYLAYFKLVGGFKKMLFMDIKSMCHYAKMYAPTLKFNKITEDELYKKAQEQAERGPQAGAIGWFGDFNSMAKKTVLRQLLKWGPMSIEMQQAIAQDEDYSQQAEEIRDTENAEQHQVVDVNKVIEDAEEVTEEQSPI